MKSFRALLMEGLRYFAEFGYTSEVDLQDWLMRLHYALEREMPTDKESRTLLENTLDSIFGRDMRRGLLKRVPGVSRYTLDRVAPHLRAELERRIYAGADLIKLNKKAAMEKTLQRFSGWVSSVPRGGSPETNLREVTSEILKPAAQAKFQARRVAIDQGHKLSAAVAHVVAEGEGAIAAIWHDRGSFDHGYDARPNHLSRSGRIILMRNSWAMDKGLIRKGSAPYTDDFEQPAALPFCSCWYEYITTPHRLPKELLTAQGRAWISGKPMLIPIL